MKIHPMTTGEELEVRLLLAPRLCDLIAKLRLFVTDERVEDRFPVINDGNIAIRFDEKYLVLESDTLFHVREITIDS